MKLFEEFSVMSQYHKLLFFFCLLQLGVVFLSGCAFSHGAEKLPCDPFFSFSSYSESVSQSMLWVGTEAVVNIIE